jgi:hypothetical protein
MALEQLVFSVQRRIGTHGWFLLIRSHNLNLTHDGNARVACFCEDIWGEQP